MPFKVKPADLNEKNRECQRRSRARRKALIEDLSQEVARFRSEGVSATVEMQEAAKAISLENQCLRALLAWHGISQAEVDQALASAQYLLPRLSEHDERLPLQPKTVAAVATSVSSVSSDEQAQSISPDIDFLHMSPAATASPAVHHGHNLRSHPVPSMDSYDTLSAVSSYPMLPEPLAMHPFTMEPFTMTTNHEGGQEMPCDAAADILIQIPGTQDPGMTRAALGCIGNTSCSVKNSAVFRLIDEMN
ncbi:hypothetical protein VHEMI08126 [[Torrubiella] hemipterigena]|uniref:BZIP domain-containing protein n=1 Tax=[Torrubiella] hemipterigena TaxID=1531966 RepID=A0A0A1TMM5_9HYPO|nr:hypothetical protein VHEMI08126 [[Torrubiella] hemipterigena]